MGKGDKKDADRAKAEKRLEQEIGEGQTDEQLARAGPGRRTWQRPHIARPLRASAEPLRGCAGQPCALRTA